MRVTKNKEFIEEGEGHATYGKKRLIREEDSFPGWEGWFENDSSTLHLLCTLFPLLLYQFHFRSSGIRSWKLETADSIMK